MIGADAISCIIYAAKSTEDRRGSIPDQLSECRAAIEHEPGRTVLAEYRDEAMSAFTHNRGPGLAQAMRHAQELAEGGGVAELWALHSDRLARGDGRVARHAVEIALWALKRDVTVRTVQDPDTFRDLLYAVVTGQRNNEDSRRKGLASAAGRRRAVERGEYSGAKPDGYMRVVEVDDAGQVTRRLDIDPVRRPLMELMFAMALRGKGTAAIANAVNDAGWQTKPLIRRQRPKSWNVQSVLNILQNPRYAGLSVSRGQVLGYGQWPTYITERQHYKLKARFAAPRPTRTPRMREPYLLSRIAKCGYCGAGMHCHTGEQRIDGSFIRTYCCWSHYRGTGAMRCPAPRIDADVVEGMFASVIYALLFEGEQPEPLRRPAELARSEGQWTDSPERQRALDALAAGDASAVDAALQALLVRMAPEAMMLQRLASSGRLARRLDLARRMQSWASQERTGRTAASRGITRELNHQLRVHFASVTLAMDRHAITIVACARTDGASLSITTRFSSRDYRDYAPENRRCRVHRTWEEAEIIDALRTWTKEHGRSPKLTDWHFTDPDRPTSHTVRRRFGSWGKALHRAGLKPAARVKTYRPRSGRDTPEPPAPC
jgi:DNA invertase Pin-like site-specific DNA recombinase